MSEKPDARVTAAILGSGRTLADVANAAAIISGLGCWYVGNRSALLLLGFSLVAWFVQSYFAVRVVIDAKLFLALADGEASESMLDDYLGRWQFKRITATPTMAQRTQGALRLWKRQRYSLVLQVLRLAAALVFHAAQSR